MLGPGGRLGLVWNTRDERVGWVAQLGRIMAMGQPEDPDLGDVWATVGAPFGPVEERRWEWTHRVSRDALLDLVASRSYVITAPDAARIKLFDDLRELIKTHPELAGRDYGEIPYLTRAFRTSAG